MLNGVAYCVNNVTWIKFGLCHSRLRWCRCRLRTFCSWRTATWSSTRSWQPTRLSSRCTLDGLEQFVTSNSFFILKMGHPRPLFHFFCYFKTTYNFTTQKLQNKYKVRFYSIKNAIIICLILFFYLLFVCHTIKVFINLF